MRIHIMENKRGFTLAELLVVVAIIGVLVAISIPVFIGKKEKAQIAADAANIRNAKACVITTCMMEDNYNTGGTFFYDADKGTVKQNKKDIAPYGQAHKIHDNATGIPEDNILELKISSDFEIESISWVSTRSGESGGNTPETGGELSQNVQDMLDAVGGKDWNNIRENKKWGVRILPGTVLTEGNKTVIVFSNHNYYDGDMTKVSLEEFSGKFQKHLIEVNTQMKVLSEEECKNDLPGQGWRQGTIAHYKGEYYILKEQSIFVQNYNADDIINGGRWTKIKR